MEAVEVLRCTILARRSGAKSLCFRGGVISCAEELGTALQRLILNKQVGDNSVNLLVFGAKAFDVLSVWSQGTKFGTAWLQRQFSFSDAEDGFHQLVNWQFSASLNLLGDS